MGLLCMAYLLEHDKKMFRSTFLVIILAIFGFGIIFGLIAGVVGSMVEKQQSVEPWNRLRRLIAYRKKQRKRKKRKNATGDCRNQNLCGSRSDDCFSCDITLGNVFRF